MKGALYLAWRYLVYHRVKTLEDALANPLPEKW